MQVDFYHLVTSPLERVLPQICEKVLGSGERLLIVTDPPLVPQLDEMLWSYTPESFLPHGVAGGEGTEDQPILLSSELAAPNGASHVAIADGKWREEALAFNRAFYFFDASRVEEARAAWRSVKAKEGVEPRYWKQNEAGRWEQAA